MSGSEATGRDPWIDADLQSVTLRLARVEASCRVSRDPRVRRAATTAAFLRTRASDLARRLARIARSSGAELPRPARAASAPGASGRVQPLVTLGPGGDFRQQLVPDGAGHIDVIG